MEAFPDCNKNKIRIMILLLLITLNCASASYTNLTVEQQLAEYKKESGGRIKTLTTSAGAPVYKNDISIINKRVLDSQYFMDAFPRFTRERIPERLVHAKGAGAFGYFEVTQNISDITRAKLFSEDGKRTPVGCRFSSVFYERGGPDTPRDTRGFACKFYTEHGNFDLLMLNTETFVLKDPIKFIDFTHVFKRNPQTNVVPDENMRWNYLVNNPESILFVLNVFGDGGIPDGFRSLPGFAIHPFQVVNEDGDISFVKFSWTPELPISNLTTEQAEQIQSKDLEYATRDLYNAIANGNYPSWSLTIQVLSQSQVQNANFDVFDITKLWPKSVRKMKIGRLILNRNPANYFAEVEQIAFNPNNLVPGILGGVDTVFHVRRFVYQDTQTHRLGSNMNKIDINCPFYRPSNYIRDGIAPVRDNGENAPNYYPNLFNGPVPSYILKPELYQPYVDPKPNNLKQASDVYNEMSVDARRRLLQNIVSSLKKTDKSIQKNAIKYFKRVDKDLAQRVSQRLSDNNAMSNSCLCFPYKHEKFKF